MPDIHPSVGKFTVTGNLNVGLLDSNDPGDQPDSRPLEVGTVEIVPWRDGAPMTTPLAVLADESVLVLESYTASIDSSGRLVGPGDGQSTPGTTTRIDLIAPDQTAISENGWAWKFTFKPAKGRKWKEFSVFLYGAPGETKTIGRAVMDGDVSTLARVMAAVVIYGDSIETVTVADVPPGTSNGALCILLPTGYEPDPETPLASVPTFIYRA